jgi:hypothetical protein
MNKVFKAPKCLIRGLRILSAKKRFFEMTRLHVMVSPKNYAILDKVATRLVKKLKKRRVSLDAALSDIIQKAGIK